MRNIFLFIAFLILTLPTISSAAVPEITRTQFCTQIIDHEPGDSPASINIGLQTLYFFTEILNGESESISHRWFYNDVQIADVVLKIGADRWRTWSTKQVWHLPPGTLKVQVLDATGTVLIEEGILIE